MSYLRTSHAGARLRWAGLFGLIAALSLCLTPGIADAAKKGKKKNQVRVLSQNLYLGSDLAPVVAAANAGQPGPVTGPADPNQCGFPTGILACTAQRAAAPDSFINEVGFVLNDVQANDFIVRAQTIANQIKKNKVDLVGLQEAALWRIEIPTDGGGPPRGTSALVPLIDYIDVLLDELNEKARTKKQCKKQGPQGQQVLPGLPIRSGAARGRHRAARRFRQQSGAEWDRWDRTGVRYDAPVPMRRCLRPDDREAGAAVSERMARRLPWGRSERS